MEITKNYLLDTNMLVLAMRNTAVWGEIKSDYALNNENTYISYITQAEILSLSAQFGWGANKQAHLREALKYLKIIPIESQAILEAYIQIDLYSQKKLKGIEYPQDFTPRNMGKNDIWIAATAFVTNTTLLSTDKDFQHLKDVFIDFVWIEG